MDIQETDPRLIEDLVHYFSEKKRLTLKNYRHISSSKDNDHFKKAARLCKEYELDAATYVQLMYDRMGTKTEFFSPISLQGTNVAHFLEERKNDDGGYKVEITNATLDPADVWDQQKALAMVYVNNGEDSGSVMFNSSLKFFAWFRILATPNRCEPVIAKYKHIARKELTNKIIDFAKSEGLDIDRIQG